MNLATITGGAYALSELVTVSAAVANGTVVLVCRGEYLLGSAAVSAGVATVAVPPLASGDIIQASVTERGNQAGLPVQVGVNPAITDGWLKAKTIRVYSSTGYTDYSTAAYLAEFQEAVGASYNPLGAGLSRLPVDYDKLPTVELGFDVEQVRLLGQTTLRVVPRNGEGLLVGWNGATPGSAAPLTVTTSATVTVAVVRDDNPGVTLNRSLPVVVLPAPSPVAPAPTDIYAGSWRDYRDTFRITANSLKNLEGQVVGYSGGGWKATTYRNGTYQEIDFGGVVPVGTYTANVRVAGDSNPANYFSFTINVV